MHAWTPRAKRGAADECDDTCRTTGAGPVEPGRVGEDEAL
jgi:hypothetical protein